MTLLRIGTNGSSSAIFKINNRDYVVLIIYLSHKKGIDRVSEAELHKIIYFAGKQLEELKKYKFLEKPNTLFLRAFQRP